MRNTLLTFMILLSFSALGQNFDELNFGTDSTLDIITWNVENFPKNGNTTINYLEQTIEALDADIIAFQEIGETEDFISIIDNMPQYDYYIGDWYYTALVFIYKPEIIKNVNLYEIYTSSAYWSPFPRSPLVIEFTCLGQEYAIINNHLKCCGDGYLEMNNDEDEEFRRYSACSLLKTFIDDTMDDIPVIVLGDMNDELDDPVSNNVFQLFINDTSNYRFNDMDIATGDNSNWSYPSYPSHLDHILITNELFDIADNTASKTEVIKVDDVFSSWWDYDYNLSDHRPVGIKLYSGTGLNSNEFIKETLSIFPNPANNKIQISANNNILQVEIISTDGRQMLSLNTEGKNIPINIEKLSEGTYILKAKSDKGIIIEKFIKL